MDLKVLTLEFNISISFASKMKNKLEARKDNTSIIFSNRSHFSIPERYEFDLIISIRSYKKKQKNKISVPKINR